MVASSCTHNRGLEAVALSGARPRFYCRHSRRTIKLLFHISRLSSHSYRPGVPRLSLMKRHVNPRIRRIPSKAVTLTFPDVTIRYRSSDDATKSGIRSFDLSRVVHVVSPISPVIWRIRVTLMRRAIHSLINDCQSNRMARSKRREIKWKFNPLMSYTFAFMLACTYEDSIVYLTIKIDISIFFRKSMNTNKFYFFLFFIKISFLTTGGKHLWQTIKEKKWSDSIFILFYHFILF